MKRVVLAGVFAAMVLAGCERPVENHPAVPVVSVPNAVDDEYIVSRSTEFTSRVMAIGLSAILVESIPQGPEKTRVIEEAMVSAAICEQLGREHNTALERYTGPNKYKPLDISGCRTGMNAWVQHDKPVQGNGGNQDPVAAMAAQIAGLFKDAESKRGTERQALIIRANALLNECRVLANSLSVDPVKCVAE